MQCDDTDRLIDALFDREAGDPERRELESHLGACEACRRAYGPLIRLLTRPPDVVVPPDLEERVLAAVAQAAAGAHDDRRARIGPALLRFARLHKVRRVGALAAALAVFVLGWVISGWWDSRATRPEPPARPQVVLLSPYALTAMAQALASHTPTGPLNGLVQAAATDLLIQPLLTEPAPIPERRAPASRYAVPEPEPGLEEWPAEVPALPPLIRL